MKDAQSIAEWLVFHATAEDLEDGSAAKSIEAFGRQQQLELLDKLNKKIFYSSANPEGQYVKDCIVSEMDKLSAIQSERAKLTKEEI